MPLYSTILALWVLGILFMTITSMTLYFFSKKSRNFLESIPYFIYLKIIGIIAISATTFAMIYQLYFELDVCILCWWQRIFIFPIDIIVLVSLWKRIRWNHIITGILSFIGLFFAGYHYYYHFMGHVMGYAVSMPCEVGWLLPACTSHEWVLIFGFITIPFMSVCVLLAILWLSWLAGRAKK